MKKFKCYHVMKPAVIPQEKHTNILTNKLLSVICIEMGRRFHLSSPPIYQHLFMSYQPCIVKRKTMRMHDYDLHCEQNLNLHRFCLRGNGSSTLLF